MTKTVQPVSPALIQKAKRVRSGKKSASSSSCIDAVRQAKSDARETLNIVLSVKDSLNYLNSVLLRLDNVMGKTLNKI